MNSYNPEHLTLDGSIKKLSELSSKLARQANPPRAGGSEDVVSPAVIDWCKDVNKFKTALSTVDNISTIIRDVNRTFVDKFAEKLAGRVFDDETGSVNDSFFKSSDFVLAVSTLTRLPLHAVYTESVKRCGTDGNLVPIQILLYFYAVVCSSISDDHPRREEFEYNLTSLCDHAEAVSPGSGPKATMTSVVATTSSASTASGASRGQEPNVDAMLTMMSTLLGGMFGGNAPGGAAGVSSAIMGMKDVVKSLVDKVKQDEGEGDAGPLNAGEIINRLGDAFKSPEMQKQIEDSAKNVSSLLEALTPSPPD